MSLSSSCSKVIITSLAQIKTYDPLLTSFWSQSVGRISFLYLKVSLLSISSGISVFTLAACLNTRVLILYLLFISTVIDLFQALIIFC